MLPVLLLSLAIPSILGVLTGAPADATIKPSDPNVLFAISAINDYYAKQGDNAVRTLTKVVKAQTQVVAGTLYHLTLAVDAGGQDELCKVSVWSRPWLPADEATQLSVDPTCKQVTMTAPNHQFAGGENAIDIKDADVQNALNFAVTSINAQENYMFNRKAIKVEKVTSQVVSGMAYHFYGVHMASTDCMKGSTTLLDNCNVADSADTRLCNFDVWWQSWMTPEYQITNVQCK